MSQATDSNINCSKKIKLGENDGVSTQMSVHLNLESEETCDQSIDENNKDDENASLPTEMALLRQEKYSLEAKVNTMEDQVYNY